MWDGHCNNDGNNHNTLGVYVCDDRLWSLLLGTPTASGQLPRMERSDSTISASGQKPCYGIDNALAPDGLSFLMLALQTDIVLRQYDIKAVHRHEENSVGVLPVLTLTIFRQHVDRGL